MINEAAGKVRSRRPRLQRGDLISIVVLGLVLLIPWMIVNLIQGSAPWYRNYDPEVQYFMNSLVAFKGHSYYYVDHPGTPIEVIGSILLALTFPFVAPLKGNFVHYYLQNPNTFLLIARLFVTACGIGCAVFMGRTAAGSRSKPVDLLIGLAIPLMFFVIDPGAFGSLTFWSHASANFPFGTLILVMLYLLATRDAPPSLREWALLGLLSGLLTSVMIYFGAWIGGMLLMIVVWHRLAGIAWRRTLLTWLTVIGSAAMGFGAMLLPAFRRVPYFLYWMDRLTFHQGIYGSGPSGITSLPSMLTGAQQLLASAPTPVILLGVIIAIYTCVLIWKRHTVQQQAGMWALGAGLIAQMAVLILVAIKHPMDRYLLPVAATLPVALMVILQVLPDGHWSRRGLTWCAIIAVLGLVPLTLVRFANDQSAQVEYVQNVYKQEQAAIADYSKVDPTPGQRGLILWTYGTYSPCYALQFGNEYSWSAFSSQLSDICPRQYQFYIWDGTARIDTKRKTLDTLNWNLIITTKSIMDGFPYLARYGTVVDYPYDVVVVQNTQSAVTPASSTP